MDGSKQNSRNLGGCMILEKDGNQALASIIHPLPKVEN